MNYLESAVLFKELICDTNTKLLEANSEGLKQKNLMVVRTVFGKEIDVKMDSFSNEFVKKTIGEYDSEAFVMTDLVTTLNNGTELTYFLYKGYHKLFDKGLVYFQLVDKNTLKPIGDIEFSNLEENIFYSVDAPEQEESSCNAIETDENTAKEPSIAFLIGHMNEDRLLYDINRLIFDTANNVQKHKNRHFKFYLRISVFGKEITDTFLKNLDAVQKTVETKFSKSYTNSTFIFDLEKK